MPKGRCGNDNPAHRHHDDLTLRCEDSWVVGRPLTDVRRSGQPHWQPTARTEPTIADKGERVMRGELVQTPCLRLVMRTSLRAPMGPREGRQYSRTGISSM